MIRTVTMLHNDYLTKCAPEKYKKLVGTSFFADENLLFNLDTCEAATEGKVEVVVHLKSGKYVVDNFPVKYLIKKAKENCDSPFELIEENPLNPQPDTFPIVLPEVYDLKNDSFFAKVPFGSKEYYCSYDGKLYRVENGKVVPVTIHYQIIDNKEVTGKANICLGRNKHKNYTIGRLMLLAWGKANYNNCTYVIHKDGNVHNNRLDNLKWSSYSISKTNQKLKKSLELLNNYNPSSRIDYSKPKPKRKLIRCAADVVTENNRLICIGEYGESFYTATKEGKIFSYKKNKQGYYVPTEKTQFMLNSHATRPVVELNIKGQRRKYSAALLIAKAFELPNPKQYYYIKNKDGNVFNNALDNLQWVNKRVYNAKKCKNVITTTKLVKNALITQNRAVTVAVDKPVDNVENKKFVKRANLWQRIKFLFTGR